MEWPFSRLQKNFIRGRNLKENHSNYTDRAIFAEFQTRNFEPGQNAIPFPYPSLDSLQKSTIFRGSFLPKSIQIKVCFDNAIIVSRLRLPRDSILWSPRASPLHRQEVEGPSNQRVIASNGITFPAASDHNHWVHLPGVFAAHPRPPKTQTFGVQTPSLFCVDLMFSSALDNLMKFWPNDLDPFRTFLQFYKIRRLQASLCNLQAQKRNLGEKPISNNRSRWGP